DTDTLDVGRGTITRVGVGGYWLAADGVVGKGRILCHPGLGNSVGWADLDNRLAVAICHNRQGLAFAKPLATAIERAFRVVEGFIASTRSREFAAFGNDRRSARTTPCRACGRSI